MKLGEVINSLLSAARYPKDAKSLSALFASKESALRLTMEHAIRSVKRVDERVADAMVQVPRHEFVPSRQRGRAYENTALSIGNGQTISQPSLVAHMLSELKLPEDARRVLDVGTGSGYQAAILAHLAKEVIGVERIPSLADAARQTLQRIGYSNVEIRLAKDDVLGYPEGGPYDGIIAGAAAPDLPASLVAQLAPNARLVIPVGTSRPQRILSVKRDATGDGYSAEYGVNVLFVPLIGPEAW